jgi:hypothetical protein
VPSPGPRPLPLRSLALAVVATAAACALAACDSGTAPQQAAVTPGRSADPARSWSRSDFGAHLTETADAGPTASATVDPLAFDDFLKAVPSAQPAPTDPDGGTLIGTSTGTATTASAVAVVEPPQRTKKGTIQLGTVAVQTEMASPALEREARAQLYFPLVTRCRGGDGKVLPPDAVTLEFTIDVDGYIVPQNISATAASADHAAAAKCMRRELSGLPFRGPAGARGQMAHVKMTVPSVD